MIISEVRGNIYSRWRDENNERVTELDENYLPYFFIGTNEDMPEYLDYKNYGNVKRVRPTYEFGEWRNLNGDPLVKVTMPSTNDVYNLRNKWKKTYEADISLPRKYCNDNLQEIKEYNLRKWYIDIETQVGGRHNGKINALTFYDSYDKEYYVMTWWPSEPIPQINNVTFYEDEDELLEAFVNYVEEKDPDMFIGWYINGFDIPTILKRLVANNINPRRLSPHNEVRGVTHNEIKNVKYTNTAQPIKGRINYCLMTTFERLWIDSQKGTLPSLSLDYCSKRLLGDNSGKLRESKFTGDEFFMKAWLEDTETFLEYNRVDVELMVKIDEVMNISENSLALQRLLICPFDCTFYNSQMGAAYFMRNADWIAPTGIKGDKQKYEAAFVMNPDEEQTFGIHENVAVLDFKSLYPSMMASRNISWETKDYISPVGEFTEEYHKVAFDVPKNLQDWEKQNIDVCYSKDELGVLPKAVLSLMHMRDEYKTNRKNAKNDEEYRKWDSAQMATKRVVNAFYGVLAKDGYGWGDVDMAQSITASAREAMRSVAFKAIEYGYDVIYGHTDSIFVKVKGVGDAKQLCLRLNDYIRNEVFNECVELEFEKLAETFFLSKKKNRYCGFLSWKDGEYLKEKDFFVMGFETKKSNETKFAKDFQENILKMVADKKEEKEVTKYAKELYKKIIDGEIPFEDVVKRMRMRRELDEYKSISGGMSGVYYNNKYNVGQPINVGDSFYYYTVDNNKIKEYPRQFEVNGILRNVEYIASKDIQDLDNNFPVAWKRLAESEVIKKVNLIYESMGWNLNSISDSGEQKTLDEWW